MIFHNVILFSQLNSSNWFNFWTIFDRVSATVQSNIISISFSLLFFVVIKFLWFNKRNKFNVAISIFFFSFSFSLFFFSRQTFKTKHFRRCNLTRFFFFRCNSFWRSTANSISRVFFLSLKLRLREYYCLNVPTCIMAVYFLLIFWFFWQKTPIRPPNISWQGSKFSSACSQETYFHLGPKNQA